MVFAVLTGCAEDGPCDGAIDLGEECDDGNQDPYDGCDCTAQPPWQPPLGEPGPFVVVEDDGAWCWFQDERAVFVDGRLVVSTVSHAGDIQVSAFDPATGARDHGVLHRGLERDDHDAASLWLRPDGRLTAFYTRHDGDPTMYWRTQAGVGLATWEAEQRFTIRDDISYSNPFALADGVHLFFRGANYNPTVAVSTDGAQTFGEPRQLIDSYTQSAGQRTNQRPYVKYASDGRDVHVFYTDGHPSELATTSLYHLVYRDGALARSDGARIADRLPGPETGTRIHDGSALGSAWIWDAALDAGTPVAVFATFAGGEHAYHYARWDGAAWQVHRIASAGGAVYSDQPFYSGGIAIDPDDPSVVYFAANAGTRHFELYRGVTGDAGAHWTITAVTAGSTVDNLRPMVPAHHATPTAVTWMQGTYHSYIDWNTRIVALLGAADAIVEPITETVEASPIARFAVADPVLSRAGITVELIDATVTGDLATGEPTGDHRLRVRVHGLAAGGRYRVRIDAYAPFESEPTLWFRSGTADRDPDGEAFLGAFRPGNSPEPGDGTVDLAVTADELGRLELVASTLDGSGETVLGGLAIFERPRTEALAAFDVDAHAGVATAPGFTSLAFEAAGFTGSATQAGITVTLHGDRRGYIEAEGDAAFVEADAALGANALTVDVGGLVVGQTYEVTVYTSDLAAHRHHAARWQLDEAGREPRVVAGFQVVSAALAAANSFTFVHTAHAPELRLRATDVYWRGSTDLSVVIVSGLVIRTVKP